MHYGLFTALYHSIIIYVAAQSCSDKYAKIKLADKYTEY